MKNPWFPRGLRVAAVGFEASFPTCCLYWVYASTALLVHNLRPDPFGTGFGCNGTGLGLDGQHCPPGAPRIEPSSSCAPPSPLRFRHRDSDRRAWTEERCPSRWSSMIWLFWFAVGDSRLGHSRLSSRRGWNVEQNPVAESACLTCQDDESKGSSSRNELMIFTDCASPEERERKPDSLRRPPRIAGSRPVR
jgi:hypothetical protein